MDKKKDLADKLRSSGLRPTKQRVRLAEYLFNRSKTFHFTVENLDKLVNSKINSEKISLATFYNTVHAFTKAGHLIVLPFGAVGIFFNLISFESISVS